MRVVVRYTGRNIYCILGKQYEGTGTQISTFTQVSLLLSRELLPLLNLAGRASTNNERDGRLASRLLIQFGLFYRCSGVTFDDINVVKASRIHGSSNSLPTSRIQNSERSPCPASALIPYFEYLPEFVIENTAV